MPRDDVLDGMRRFWQNQVLTARNRRNLEAITDVMFTAKGSGLIVEAL
jgi:hypothetical protein